MRVVDIAACVEEIKGKLDLWSREMVDDFASQEDGDGYWRHVSDADIEEHNKKIVDAEKRGGYRKLYLRIFDQLGLQQKAFVSSHYCGEWKDASPEVRNEVASVVADAVRQAVLELMVDASCPPKGSR